LNSCEVLTERKGIRKGRVVFFWRHEWDGLGSMGEKHPGGKGLVARDGLVKVQAMVKINWFLRD